MQKTVAKDSSMPIFAILVILGLISGCSSISTNSANSSRMVTAQAPLPTGYLLTTQPKMQALAHWDQHAARVARGCARALDHFYPHDGLSVYVAPAGSTSFARSYRESLLTRLVDFGVPISLNPEEGAVLEINLEYVKHRRTHEQTKSGVRQSVEPNFTQVRNDQGKYGALPVISEEAGYFEAQIPTSEIQINTALILRDRFLYRDTSFFYVNEPDWAHYRQQPPRGEVDLKRFTLIKP